ncbi:phosphotransferase (plasmid) [Mesorhizobium sp. AR02]|uniref:phosphotransferase family protein n=1 Tax=Mesorhizobium sp. AR02 TaxID=2865837 RepID=UPI00215EA294|nr:phosphotransferase [Mesorhizobium sp. AR02]UVK49624.1 phosphotransferase [Mesorhizobium sp. AR02]
MSTDDSSDRLVRLSRSISLHFSGTCPVKLTPYREGVDCWVDLVERFNAPLAVVRSAKSEIAVTRYDGIVDFGVEIEKQVRAAALLRLRGVATPAVLEWNRTTDLVREPSWMLLEFVEHAVANWEELDLHFQLGTIARCIHAIETTDPTLALFRRSGSWSDWITERILMRAAAAGRYIHMPKPDALRLALLTLIGRRDEAAKVLLHLDLRPPNLAVRGGRIVSVLDLGNAIVGDPLLELARIRGCGLLSPVFLRGYGLAPTGLDKEAAILDAFELDLVLLLVVVSLEGAVTLIEG